MEFPAKEFGLRLKALREARGLTKSALARDIRLRTGACIGRDQLRMWEAGERAIHLDSAWILAKYFGVSISDFFPDCAKLAHTEG